MEEYSVKDLGKRIRTARKAKQKTQDEVAAAIGVNNSMPYSAEHNARSHNVTA